MLTKDRKHLLIFDERIEVDKSLPKWRSISNEVKKKVEQRVPADSSGTTSLLTTPDNTNTITFSNYNVLDDLFVDTGSSSHGLETIGKATVNIDDTAKMDIRELTG